MKKLLALMIVLATLGGCAEGEQDFEFAVTPESAIVIKTGGSSCLAIRRTEGTNSVPPMDIQSNYAEFRNLRIKYLGDPKLTLIIAYIEVRFELGAGDQKVESKVFAGDELITMVPDWWTYGEAAVGGLPITNYRNPTEKYTPQAEITSNCSLKLGSLPGGAAYTATATVFAEGYLRDQAGNTIDSATARTTVNVKFKGDQ